MNEQTPRWHGEISPGELDAALALLRQAIANKSTVVVASHVSPDGDTLGSALALHLVLRAYGVDTRPTVGEQPLKVPAALAALPGVEDLTSDALPDASEVDLLLAVDAASPDRLGIAAGYLDAQVPALVVDHHASGTTFGDVRVVAPTAAATVMVVGYLLDAMDVPLTRDVATCLYAGLVTDTGRFSHATTDSSAMRFGARLLEAGVDHAGLNRRLFDTRSFAQLRLFGAALHRAEIVPDVALVHTYVTGAELAASGGGIEAVEPLVDLLHTVDIAEVALVLKPATDGTWRVSMRSQSDADVGTIAEGFGGGGHARAAGFSAEGDAEEVVAAVAGALRNQPAG